jgi:outer membrane protein OmpA-like peptidoglycan-associated protein
LHNNCYWRARANVGIVKENRNKDLQLMKPDRDRNPESRKVIRFARATVSMAAVMLLAGCSTWADPTEWFGSDSAAQTGESATAPAVKTPGADKDYPNLASVPERPKAPSEEDRKRLADSLTADRDNAEYSKDVIRRQSASSVPAPPPPPPSASSVQARATAAAAARANAAAPAASAAAQAVTPLPAPPAPIARTAPAATVAGAGSALSQAPVSQPPRFAPRPPSPVAAAAGANSVAPLTVRPSPNVRSIARIGNPSFGAPPSDIAAALGAGSPQRASPSRFAAPQPRVSGTFSNGTSPGGAEPVAMVRFKAGSASLTGSARQQVRQIVGMYRQRGGAIRVEGHASSRTRNMDPVQHHLVNFNVSLNRANAVARELARQGVPSEAVFVAAMSDSQPLYYEVMPAGDAGNQRVEIHFVN